MELGLSLGETKKPFDFLSKNREIGTTITSAAAAARKQTDSGLGFCMGLGISTNGTTEAKRRGVSEDDEYLDESIRESCHNRQRVSSDPPVQLDLLPLAPVPRRTLGLHWSSDNGSSERDSSGNGLRGVDVNKPPSVADELSSPKSVASSFPLDFSLFGAVGNGGVGGKRDSEDPGNNLFEAERASSRASDEDENGLNSRKKLRLTKEQSAFLEESFKEHNTLNPKQKLALAKQLNLRPRQVEVWFQNRRARTKLKQTEVDCEYLKRCYETLTEENRRLHKELQELRALKASNPFYMQSPATTLTMCPSCERVGPTSAAPPTTISSSVATIPTTTTNDSTTPKGMTFPMRRPKFFPYSNKPTTSHPHQSAAS